MSTQHNLRSSVAWNAVSLGGLQGIRIVATLVLVRILGPGDFGIAGQAIAYIALVDVFASFGLTSVIVQHPEFNDRYRYAATWIALLSCAGAAVLTFGSAPLVSRIFDTPELVAVVRVLAFMVLARAVALVPTALLMRDLRFEILARAELGSAAFGAAAGVIAAWLKAGYWAPIVQMLVTSFILALALLSVEQPRLGRTDRKSVGQVSKFGVTILLGNWFNYGSRNGDNLMIGATLGATSLGLYDLGYRVLSIPLQVVGQTVNRTLMPAFSRLQSDQVRVAELFERSARGMAILVTGPLIIVALAAGDAVPWVFGSDWDAAIVPIRWIAIAGIFRLIFGSTGIVLVSMGHPGWQSWWSALATSLSVAGFVVGLHWWGINGVAASITVLGFPIGLASVWIASHAAPISTKRVLAGLVPPMVAGLGTAGLWVVTGSVISIDSVPGRLTVRCSIGIAGYVAMLLTASSTRADLRLVMKRPSRKDQDTIEGLI